MKIILALYTFFFKSKRISFKKLLFLPFFFGFDIGSDVMNFTCDATTEIEISLSGKSKIQF